MHRVYTGRCFTSLKLLLSLQDIVQNIFFKSSVKGLEEAFFKDNFLKKSANKQGNVSSCTVTDVSVSLYI